MKSPHCVRDTRKWCEFHQDYSHQIDECHALLLEVAELLKQGHLKDLLTERDRVTRDKSLNGTKNDVPPVSLRQDIIINVISGGSKVSEVSYIIEKRSSHRIVRTNLHKIGHHDPGVL